METDAAVDKVSDLRSCPQRLGKACWLSHSSHRPGGAQQQTTKPDTSLAIKTGHFHLLPTREATTVWVRDECAKREVISYRDCSRQVSSTGIPSVQH